MRSFIVVDGLNCVDMFTNLRNIYWRVLKDKSTPATEDTLVANQWLCSSTSDRELIDNPYEL